MEKLDIKETVELDVYSWDTRKCNVNKIFRVPGSLAVRRRTPLQPSKFLDEKIHAFICILSA